MAEEPLTPAQQSGEIPQNLVALAGEWQFINTTTAPPSTGQIRLNSGQQTSATAMFVNRTSALGVDAAGMLADIKPGHVLKLQTRDDAARWNTYLVTNNPINQGDVYTEIPVAWRSGGQPLAQQRTMLTTDSVPIQVSPTGNVATASVGTVTVDAIANVVVPVQGVVMRAEVGEGDVVTVGMNPGYAFPSDTVQGISLGMTIRQYYAGQALIGFLSSAPAANLIDRGADFCFRVADSMIAYEARQASGQTQPPVGSTIPEPMPPQEAPTVAFQRRR